jgi:hypothetical protein
MAASGAAVAASVSSGRGNRQEEMQRQRRQEEPGRLVEEVDPAPQRVGRKDRREDVEHRRRQAPEIEQRPAGGVAGAPDDEQADRGVGAADERQDQVGSVEIERRAAVLDGRQALVAQDDELRRRCIPQDGGETGDLADFAPVDQDDAVAGFESGLEQRIDALHFPMVAGGGRLEAERLEGLELLLEAACAQDRQAGRSREEQEGGEAAQPQ